MPNPKRLSRAGGNPQQLITNNLNIWTAAIKKRGSQGRGSSKKIELYGIKKLRELILELAVRGLLVPQNPNDEPASVLLEKIEAEKEQLIKEGKIKKQKPLPEITDEEKPFELPKGWEWKKLGHLAIQITDGVHHTPKYIESGVPFISVKDIDGNRVSFDDCKYISQEQHEDINIRCNPEHGDVLICRIGTLGRVTLVDTTAPFSLFVSVGLIKFIQEYYTPRFAHIAFHSPVLLRQYEEIKAGGSHTNKLNLGDMPRLVMPIAPLAEQPRIVAKVDELMALCDQLEQQTESSLIAHQTLVDTLLKSLLDAAQLKPGHNSTCNEFGKNNDPFQNAWNLIADHFNELFVTEHSIDQLKQTILQLAVMGKLVPQNPNDEPASVLLEKIAAEKEQLIKDGKIKKQKPLPEITDEEKPFNLPKGWEWVRLGVLLNKITDGTHHSPPNGDAGEFLYISAKNIKNDGVKVSNATYVTTEVHNEIYSRCNPEKGDILYIKDGATTGIGTINQLDEPFSMLSSVALLKCSKSLLNTYVLNSMRSPYFYEEMRAGMTGVAITRVTLKKLDSAFISLPPEAEQPRIVAKVNELMALCDTLKERIRESQTTQLHLADAMAERALN